METHDEPVRVRRRNNGRDPLRSGMAATTSGRDSVGHPMAALRHLRASGGDDWVQWGLQHSRRSCVHHSYIVARNLLRLPIVQGETKPVEGRRHSSRHNRRSCFRAGCGGLWLRRSGEHRDLGCSGIRRLLCDQIEVQDQSALANANTLK